jgi:hypothetical protein
MQLENLLAELSARLYKIGIPKPTAAKALTELRGELSALPKGELNKILTLPGIVERLANEICLPYLHEKTPPPSGNTVVIPKNSAAPKVIADNKTRSMAALQSTSVHNTSLHKTTERKITATTDTFNKINRKAPAVTPEEKRQLTVRLWMLYITGGVCSITCTALLAIVIGGGIAVCAVGALFGIGELVFGSTAGGIYEIGLSLCFAATTILVASLLRAALSKMIPAFIAKIEPLTETLNEAKA